MQIKKHNLVFIEAAPGSGKEDVVGAKLLKAYAFFAKKLEPFSVVSSGWEWSGKKVFFYFLAAKNKRPEFIIHEGPPLSMKEFVADFKRKNNHTFEQGGKIMAKVMVVYPALADAVKDVLKQPYFKEKISILKRVTFA